MNVHLKLLSPEAFFSPKCTKYRLAAGLRWGAYSAKPDHLAVVRVPTSKGGEGRGAGWEGGRRDGWGGKGVRKGGRSGEGRGDMRH